MARKSAAQLAKKWAQNTQGSVQAMKDGINAVTENPAEKAAAAEDRWAEGVRRAQAEGRFRDGLSGVTLEQWKSAMLKKGVGRIADGVAQAQGTMEQFLSQFMPHVESVQREVASMPKGTPEASKARMIANMEGLSRFRFRKRG